MVRFSLTLCLSVFVLVFASLANSSRLVDRFGKVLATGDGYLFIADSGGFKTPGTVHVYVRGEDGQWAIKRSLRGPNAQVGDGFGDLIVYENGTLAVASPSAVFLFEHVQDTGDFVQTQHLKIIRPSQGALALDDDWLAVSSLQSDEIPAQVHLFQRSPEGGWSRKGTLEGPEAMQESMYGASLSMDQGRLLIGAPGDCAAYLYENQNDAWELVATLPCGDLSEDSRYGFALDLQGNYAAVSAPLHNGVGAVAVWHLETEWKEIEVLTPEDQSGALYFGEQVHIRDSYIVVGVPLAGEVRMYSVQENEQTSTLQAKPRFGSIALVNEAVIAI